MNPLISILIPAYNAANYLPECLDSVREQTYANLQIVVVDDGSSDDTHRIATDYAMIDSRIEVYLQDNQGVAAARNNLLDKAKGDYVLFVDADDWIEPDMIDALLSMAHTTNADIAMCGNFTERPGQPTERCSKKRHPISLLEQSAFLKAFLIHRVITGSLWNKLIKRSLFQNERFRCGVPYGEDALMMWHILLKTGKLAMTQQPYYHYRMNPASVSHAGGISKKMSVIPVWQAICDSVDATHPELARLAGSRYGAEVTLVLYDAASNGINASSGDVVTLRKVLRSKLFKMHTSGVISLKFLTFADCAAYCWPLAVLLAQMR